MKRGTSKMKGNSFEIQICRKLTKWVTGKERPEIFWRSASSGAKATMSKKSGHATKMHGDIMAIDSKGTFLTDNILIECKHYKDFRFEPLIEKTGLIYKWWSKCCAEAEQASKHSMLIFRRNNGKNYIIVDGYIYGLAKEWCGSWSRTNYFRIPSPLDGRIFLLDDFLEWVEVENLKRVYFSYLDNSDGIYRKEKG